MRRKLTVAWGVALAASLAGPSYADDPPRPAAYPSGQGGPGTPAPGGTAADPGRAGAGPGDSLAPGGPDGAGNPTTGPGQGPGAGPGGSGAFDGQAGGSGGSTSGLGGFASGSGAPPGIIGDFPPISNFRAVSAAATASRFPVLPTPTPPPNPGNRNPGIVNGNGTTSILFKLTGLKISDNQSPLPQDRFFYSFNYFDNLNASVDRHTLSPIQNLQVYHQLFGLEKTFLDGRASVGFRVPLNTISFKSTANVAGLGGSSTSSGDLSIFLKAILLRREGFMASGGLQVTAPTGPGGFGGSKYYSYFRDTQVQPFVGYLLTRDRLYLQGFSSINVPTTSSDVTLLFTDVGVGYYAYRASDPGRVVSAIVPTAEAHLTTPLNHRGFSSTDLASTPDILNMTFGTNLELRRRAVLSAAYVTPVTGPKPFNAEFILMLNVRFGAGRRQGPSPIAPPVF